MALDEESRASIEAFKKAMREKSEMVHTSLGKAVTTACLIVERECKESMKNTEIDSGTVYHRGTVSHSPSVPGSPPAIDTGRLVQSITHSVEEVDGSTVEGRVGTNVVYGRMLEEGTSKMAPRPWLYPALAKKRDRIHQLIGDAVKGRTIPEGIE